MRVHTRSSEPADVEVAHLVADALDEEAVHAYLRLRPLLAAVVEAGRRAESAARLEAALRLSR